MKNHECKTDEQFKKYLRDLWPFLQFGSGYWGSGEVPEAISEMTDEHIRRSINYICRTREQLAGDGRMPSDPKYLAKLEVLIAQKTLELEKVLSLREKSK